MYKDNISQEKEDAGYITWELIYKALLDQFFVQSLASQLFPVHSNKEQMGTKLLMPSEFSNPFM